MAVKTGDRAADFDLEVAHGERLTLADFLGRSNLLLVFHPLAFTEVCEDEALDLQENLDSFRNSGTEVVFVSCDPSPARQAWKQQLGVEYTFASDFWPHGAAAKAYGVFDEEKGTPFRGTFLVDRDGTVIWSLVKTSGTRRDELVPGSLGALAETDEAAQ